MPRPNAGDDSNPRSGEGGARKTAAQLAADPAFTGAYGRVHPACQGINTSLLRGRRSVTTQNTGDSTGDEQTEWFGLLGSLLGTKFPARTVWWRAWSDTNQAYPTQPGVLQTGTAGERYYDIRSSVAFSYPGSAITGDLEIQARIAPDSYTSGTAQAIVAQWDSATNQRGIYFFIGASGNLQFSWSTDGTSGTAVTATSSTAHNPGAGVASWVRVTHKVNNAASGNDVTFYTSPDGTTWTQLGAVQTTAGVTSHFAATPAYTLGVRNLVTSPVEYLTGKMYQVHVLNGIGATAYHTLPILPEEWEPTGSGGYGGAGYTLGGAPILQLLCGSQAGQGVPYLDASARRVKLFATLGQRLLLVNVGMNDPGLWASYATGIFATWVGHLKTLIPGVPIIVLGQNPVTTGSLITTQDQVDQRYDRQADILQWAASQAGLWPVDMYPAWPSTFTPSLYLDGYLHPSSGLAGGSGLEAKYLLNYLFALQA